MTIDDLPLFENVSRKAEPALEVKPLTVTELTQQIRGTLEPRFLEVWVRGELSNVRPATSGHAYFSIKDSGASVSAAIFGWGKRARQGFELREGLEVICRGKISVYLPRGNYQLIVDQIEPLGAGALQVAFEQLKSKLQAEGLFSAERKRVLPPYPRKIAVVTSPSGAAIRDILSVLHRRAPHLEVTIIPAIVQGDGAPQQIIRALKAANELSLGEIVLLTRGGGSIEDLWCFNDEALAREIARSKLPVVSAVGHEIDFTISDFVSDLRAPTPSAAAEIISGNWLQVHQFVGEAPGRMAIPLRRTLFNQKELLRHLAARLINPRDRLREQAQRLDEMSHRLETAVKRGLERKSAQFKQILGKMDALSPLRVLERGYTLVKGGGSAEMGSGVIKSAHAVKAGMRLQITFHDGERSVEAL